MPRNARQTIGGTYYHIHNRTIEPAQVFKDSADCWKLIELINCAQERIPLDLLAVCIMPNHFHLIVRPLLSVDLGQWMQWLFTTHVRRWHSQHQSAGPIWQGRFKAFPIAPDEHLLSVMRYVEANALRARLVKRAECWAWSSLNWRCSPRPPVALTPPPLPLPGNWTELVNAAQSPQELAAIRMCLGRQNPFGTLRPALPSADHLLDSMSLHACESLLGEPPGASDVASGPESHAQPGYLLLKRPELRRVPVPAKAESS